MSGRRGPEGGPDRPERGPDRPEGAPDGPDGHLPGDTTPPGPFPSWGVLYAVVIAWAAFLVAFLWAAGRLLTP